MLTPRRLRGNMKKNYQNVKAMNVSNNEAVNKYIFFCFNYPYDFINKVWKGYDYMFIKHLENKFKECNYEINRFYIELDSEHRAKLLNWIEDNYSI